MRGQLAQRQRIQVPPYRDKLAVVIADRSSLMKKLFEPFSGHATALSLSMTVPVGAGRCSCTPLSLKRMPSASSAETTRCRARALALGTLPLDPSQAVKHGREIEARSASSCCERPVRLRAARNMPPVISTIVMLRLFARRQRTSMSVYFTNSLTPPTGLGLLGVAPRRHSPSVGQRVARSLPERWPAVLPRGSIVRFKAI